MIKIVIPVIIEKVTDKCLDRFDIDYQQLILIDNSRESFAKKYEGRGAQIYYHPENLGVPGSWNLGLKSEADFVWIVSSSLIFNAGFSELVEKMPQANEWGLLTDQAWHCIGFTRKTVDTIGYFDEQFYPGYYEDNDYGYRLQLAGIHNDGVHELPKVSLDVHNQGNALTMRSGIVNVKFYRNQEYYQNKWGGLPGKEVYTAPFGRTA